MMYHRRSARATRRRILLVVALAVLAASALPGSAAALGPGGWDHLGLGANAAPALNGAVRTFAPGPPGVLYVGGSFTGAGGMAGADHIAAWNGSAWSAVAPGLTGDVNAIVYNGGKIYAGGTFTNAGGNADADFLAVWDGVSWTPFCPNTGGPGFGGTVSALQVIGGTLYVGGAFQNGGGLAAADYLVACDLATGTPSSTVAADGDGTGAINALTADSNGVLYAAGNFSNWDTIAAADNVASYDGAWHGLGSGSPNGGAVNGTSRAIAANGTNVYLGTDAVDIAGIAQADHVARWDGASWNALGSDTGGGNGWLPATTSINSIVTSGAGLFVTGSFQNANGDPTADDVAAFDALGNGWHPVGSDGAGGGPWIGNGLALGIFNQALYAGGSFTSAGGDTNASYGALYPLAGAPGGSGNAGAPGPGFPVPSPTGTAGLPPPTLGRTVNAVPEAGVVLVKLPPGAGAQRSTSAAARFIPLTAARQLPLGSTFDTTRGRVGLTLAGTRTGSTQTGHFSQGLFSTAQAKATGLTTMTAVGGGLNGCGTKVPKGGAPRVQAAARSRSLFSNVRGRFRTRGRNSTATVRGTQWLQKDTCAGTLTTVKSGSVTVRDFAKRKTVVVKKGKHYLARASRKAGRQ